MKKFNFLSAVIAVVLMVTAVSCTTMQGAADDEYYSAGRQVGNRIYVDDPYYGTVVLERDPYSGRYYQVSPYGYSTPYRNYNRYYRNYNNYYRDRGYYSRDNRNNNSGNNQQQTEEQKKNWEKQRDDARKKVLGG